jgi:hypothetical protein
LNRRALVIAVPLLALIAAIAVRQTLRARQSNIQPPSVAEPMVDAQRAEAGEPSAHSRNSAPNTPQADLISLKPLEAALWPGAVTTPTIRPQLRPISDAIETSYGSTIAAFALHGEEADYEAHDARAQQDAERLQQLFLSMRSDLSPELASSCEAVIDRIAAAQLQLMAFAINRKNRGLPDSAQAKAEIADREAFQDDVAPLFERVRAALNTVGTDNPS